MSGIRHLNCRKPYNRLWWIFICCFCCPIKRWRKVCNWTYGNSIHLDFLSWVVMVTRRITQRNIISLQENRKGNNSSAESNRIRSNADIEIQKLFVFCNCYMTLAYKIFIGVGILWFCVLFETFGYRMLKK